MTELANMDRYNWAQYKLDMAVNAADSEVPEFAQTAALLEEQIAQEEGILRDLILRKQGLLQRMLP